MDKKLDDSRWAGMAEHMGRKLTEAEITKLESMLMLYGKVVMDKETGEIRGIMQR